MAMETLLEAMNRLSRNGYTEQFRAENNELKAIQSNHLFNPKDMIVDEIVRFEGEANPDQMSILFAVRASNSEIKGTYYSSYGANVDPEDSDIVAHLEANSRGTRFDEENPSIPPEQAIHSNC